MSVSLERVVPWGRSHGEYELMFALFQEDLSKKILGCADGPASFNAEMTAAGHAVVSFDPLYEFSGEEIRRRFDETVEGMIAQVKATPDNWVWNFHKDVDDLLRNRRRAMELFQADYERGLSSGRYLTASLPELPFTDCEFELALCSHFLFLYSDLLDEEFHVQSAMEMCRVADEVRIFPLLTLDHSFSPHVEPMRQRLAAAGIDSEIKTVDYELQKGGNQMLWLKRKSGRG